MGCNDIGRREFRQLRQFLRVGNINIKMQFFGLSLRLL